MVKFTKNEQLEGMKKMVVQDERKERLWSFYVSEFHLEMILFPYKNEKIKKGEEITILTQKELKETLKILISKMNFEEENKQKILKLNWEGDERIKENSNIIIIGSEKYIKEKNKEIESKNSISIVDCYDLEEIKDRMNKISNEYKNVLNTLGKNKF